jgi:hypothetical protein
LNTPSNRLAIITLTVFAYLSAPLLYGATLYYQLQNGEFPTDADSIGIPFAGFIILWLICLPVFVLLCISIEMIGEMLNRGMNRNSKKE